MTSQEGYQLFAEIKRGYVIKTLIDVLAGSSTRATFSVSKDGIFLRSRDRDILFDVKLYREMFTKYKCDTPLAFTLNVKHMQKLIRSLKKKDSLVLRILKNVPLDTLCITIRPTSTNKVNPTETSAIKFQVMGSDSEIR